MHGSDDDSDVPRRPTARHDSDDDSDVPRRPKRASDEVSSSGAAADESKRQKTTAAGHAAGLQTAADFATKEKEIRTKREAELKLGDKVHPPQPSAHPLSKLTITCPLLLQGQSGEGAETVYRDKRGRKLDMLGEFMRQQSSKEGKEYKLQKAQQEWGKGSVQKAQEEAAVRELQHIAAEPFARSRDDARLEAALKQELRDGDPMAQYMARQQQQQQHAEAAASPQPAARAIAKRVYKGPAARPNRFGIPPGYRWDGIERGTSFEQRLIQQANYKASLKEDSYRWSSADM